MRFGGFIFQKWNTPEEWAQCNLDMGYSAVYFPFDFRSDLRVVDTYIQAAKAADLVIAEIGVWNNPMSRDEKTHTEALYKCVKQLEFADYVGAKCCVNIAGSYSDQWDGPHKDNLTERGFYEVVQTTQKILDAVNPTRTFYALEPMPWMFPDSADSYLRLVKEVDRKGFGVHLDPVNMINSPRLYYGNTEFLLDFFERLGPYIKSCHAKDIKIGGNLTLHLDECRPGLGELDFSTFLRCMTKLPPDVPLMLEHMDKEEDFVAATKFVKALGQKLNIRV